MFLRLELCLQCPSVHERVEDLEQVVGEASILLSATGTCCIQIVSAALKRPCGNFLKFQVTDLLRMLCLTEDSAYLAKFLEGILEL